MITDEAYNSYFKNHPEEAVIANRLDEAFDISYGKKNSSLSLWIAKPKQITMERFGLQNEILIVYSPFPRTDARVLTAIDNASNAPEYKLRIDKALYIVIHNGDMEQTKSLLKTDANRIIIPFKADEISEPQKGSVFIRQRMSSYIGEIDLFGFSSPITSDRYFFGRDELLQSLLTRSISLSENTGLFGLRKTGKTSVLKAVQRHSSERGSLAEYIECSNPGVHASRWWQLLAVISQRLKEQVGQKIKEPWTSAYNQTSAGLDFRNDIKRILELIDLPKIILLLDEIEFITPELSGSLGKHWDSDFVPFWQTIRSINQELNGCLSFIVAGVNPACVQIDRIGQTPNPIFQYAQPFYLQAFDTKSTREMVRTIGKYSGFKFDEDVYGFLCEQYGGHPFLMRTACSVVCNAVGSASPTELQEISIKTFSDLNEEVRTRLSQPIKDILLSLVWWYPEEYELLQLLASGERSFVEDYVRQNPTALIQFSNYGVLKKTAEFAIEDLREFLNLHGEEYKRSISPFKRSDLPPELLPEIPDLKALANLFEMKCKLEVQLRRLICMYMGVKFGWDNSKISKALSDSLKKRSDRQDPSQIFVGRTPQVVMNDLYTLDMKDLITNNWDTFSSLFDSNRARFEMNMDTVNKARRYDGHTKPITTNEINEFNNSYVWLLAKFEKVPGLN